MYRLKEILLLLVYTVQNEMALFKMLAPIFLKSRHENAGSFSIMHRDSPQVSCTFLLVCASYQL